MDKILDWTNFNSWKDKILGIMSDVITSEIINDFKNDAPEFVVGDDLSWLDEIILKRSNNYVNTKELLGNRLLDNYTFIRGYHGARPSDVGSYYKNGICLLSPEEMLKNAKAIFLTHEYPKITEDMVDDAFGKVQPEGRLGRIYFEANMDFLVKRCAHYMLYGSEFITAIAANLDTNIDYKYALKKIGAPVVLVCDVPLKYLSMEAVSGFSGEALKYIFLSQINNKDVINSIEFTAAAFKIEVPLSPEYVVDHIVPEKLFDPFSQQMEVI